MSQNNQKNKEFFSSKKRRPKIETTIKAKLSGGMNTVEFDEGKIDKWAIKLNHYPADLEYFSTLRTLTEMFNPKDLYESFVQVYDLTNKEIEINTLEKISEICMEYWIPDTEPGKYIKLYADVLETILVTLYYGMIAEQNKENAILGKRVKRLGVYQVLFTDMGIIDITNYSKKENVLARNPGQSAYKTLGDECTKLGF